MTSTPHQENSGMIIAVADMIVYGFFPVGAHYFVQELDPLLFAGMTALIGSLPLVGMLKWKRSLHSIYARETLKALLLISALTTVGNILFFVGTKQTSAINTGLLEQTEPIFS